MAHEGQRIAGLVELHLVARVELGAVWEIAREIEARLGPLPHAVTRVDVHQGIISIDTPHLLRNPADQCS